MTIRVSRHAQRRLKLYDIDVTIVQAIVAKANQAEGTHEVVDTVPGFKYPIKVVYANERGETTFITAFPLKKGKTE